MQRAGFESACLTSLCLVFPLLVCLGVMYMPGMGPNRERALGMKDLRNFKDFCNCCYSRVNVHLMSLYVLYI